MKKLMAIIFTLMITFGGSGTGSCYSGGGSFSNDMENQYDDDGCGGGSF